MNNPSDAEVIALLARVRNIAVLGISPKPGRPSFDVARAMQRFGFRILPVRPATAEVLGEPCHPTLAAVPERIDLVNVFRAAEHIPAVVDECIALGLPALWVQEGIVHAQAAGKARAAGITVVMDRCLFKEYLRLMRGEAARGSLKPQSRTKGPALPASPAARGEIRLGGLLRPAEKALE